MVAIFPNVCLWRRSLCSNLGGIDPKKQYRATLNILPLYNSLLFHFSSKMQERAVFFYIYLAKPLSKVHVSNNRSNTDYDPQDIALEDDQ